MDNRFVNIESNQQFDSKMKFEEKTCRHSDEHYKKTKMRHTGFHHMPATDPKQFYKLELKSNTHNYQLINQQLLIQKLYFLCKPKNEVCFVNQNA